MRTSTWMAGILSAAVVMTAVPAADADPAPGTLSVDGNGSVFVAPDVADLSLSVTRAAAASQSALSAANRATDAVVGALRAAGVPASAIQTEGVSVSSSIVRVGRERHRQRRWTASESLGVHITSIALVGPAIDDATRAGASTVNGPTFSFSDPSAGLLAATRAALADARRRADDAAAALGYRVTGVQSVDLDPQGAGLRASAGTPAAAGGRSGATPTTVHPGTQEVDAQVAVVYTIAPA